MKIKLKVKAKARQARIERIGEADYKVWVKEAPEKGRANEAVVKALGEYLSVPKSRIRITAGHASANKTATID